MRRLAGVPRRRTVRRRAASGREAATGGREVKVGGGLVNLTSCIILRRCWLYFIRVFLVEKRNCRTKTMQKS